MSIEFPDTFGEAFWSPQVEANKLFADESEKSLAPFIAEIAAMLNGLDGTPPVVSNLLNSFATTGHFGLQAIGEQTASAVTGSAITEALSPFMRLLSYTVNRLRPNKLVEIDGAATLRWRKEMPETLFDDLAKAMGYEDVIGDAVYHSLKPYPDLLDIIAWARYTTDGINTKDTTQRYVDVSDSQWDLWDFQSALRVTPAEIQALRVRDRFSEQDAMKELMRNGYNNLHAQAVLDLAYAVPNSGILLQSSVFRNEPFDFQERYVALGGIHPDYAPHFIDAVLDKPDPTTLIRYMLRHDPSLGNLDRELQRIGIHPDYLPLYKELAYPVPPIADLITMAVREAFSPEIASRFGQYDDYPQDLTRYAAMNGLSEDWAKRYWAAHWSLPSPQQGYEMLHRGIITERDLELLLRALDVMPFWREKLIEMSYNPLTRVDVRRMYALGVLTEAEVTKAYRDIGYNPDNAERLREFTVKQTIASQSGMSVSKVVTAYKNGLTSRNDAHTVIVNLGVRSQVASEIMESADLQLQWQQKKDAIASIKNRYKQELISENQAESELSSLGLESVKVRNYIQQWVSDGEKEHGTLLSKTDVITMLKGKIISETRARQEFSLLGYTKERADLLVKLTTK